MRKVVVLASGNGSLLQALIDSKSRGHLYEITAVLSDQPDAFALVRAKQAKITAIAVPVSGLTPAQWQQNLKQEILQHEPDLVISAGFMRIIRSDLFELIPTINAHPSLLPKFPGAHAVADALAAGEKVTGATVHYIDAGIDSGKIIAQREVEIMAADSVESLHERIKQVEREQLVEVVSELCLRSDLRSGI